MLCCLWGMVRGKETSISVCWLHQTLQLQGFIQLTQCLPLSLHFFPFNLSFQSVGVHTPPG